MNNHTHTQYTDIFMWKPNVGENHKTSSLCSSARTNLQIINFQLNKNPPIINNEDINPLRHQNVVDNVDTNPIRHQLITKMRTPILSELQITLAPPYHPRFIKQCYITKPFSTQTNKFIVLFLLIVTKPFFLSFSPHMIDQSTSIFIIFFSIVHILPVYGRVIVKFWTKLDCIKIRLVTILSK
jgi:hypothetical protein